MVKKKGNDSETDKAVESAAKRHGRSEVAEAKGDATALVGLKCAVWWDGEQAFFPGKIGEYNAERNVYVVDYDDGDQDTGLEILDFKIESKGRKRVVRILKSRTDDQAYLVKEATPSAGKDTEAAPAAASRQAADKLPGEEQAGNKEQHQELGEDKADLGMHGKDASSSGLANSVGEVKGAEPLSGVIGLPDDEEAREPSQEARQETEEEQLGSTELSDNLQEPCPARDEAVLVDKPTERGHEGFSQEDHEDVQQVPDEPKADQVDRQEQTQGPLPQASAAGLELSVKAPVLESIQAEQPHKSSALKAQEALPKRRILTIDTRGSDESPQAPQAPLQPTAQRQQETVKSSEGRSEGRGSFAGHQNVPLGAGICKWRINPSVEDKSKRASELPLKGRIKNWPFATLLPQNGLPLASTICTIRGGELEARPRHEPASLPKPITLAPPASGKLSEKHFDRQKHRLADVSLPGSGPLHVASPLHISDDTETLMARHPSERPAARRRSIICRADDHITAATEQEDHLAPITTEQVALVRKKAEAVARAQSERLGKLKEQSKLVKHCSRSRSRERRGEDSGKSEEASHPRPRDRNGRDRDLYEEGQAKTHQRWEEERGKIRSETTQRDGTARRHRDPADPESRANSKDRWDMDEGLEKRTSATEKRPEKRPRESGARAEAEAANGDSKPKRSQVVYLSDKKRMIPGNQGASRSRAVTPRSPYRKTGSPPRAQKEQRSSRSRSRSRSRSKWVHSTDRRRQSRSRSRERKARGRSSTQSHSQTPAEKDRSSEEDRKSRKRSRSPSAVLDARMNGSSKSRRANESARVACEKLHAGVAAKLSGSVQKQGLAPPEDLLPANRRFRRGRVFVCNSAELEECLRNKTIGGSRPSDREEICVHTAIFLYNSTLNEMTGIFCGEDQPPSRDCRPGPFKYQTWMRRWRRAVSVPVSAAKAAVGAHPNRHSRCPIPELLSEKQVGALCYEFKLAASDL